MKNIPDKSIDLVLTDPPYGMNYKRHIPNPRYESILNDNNLNWLPDVLDEYKRILKDNSNIYIYCSWHNVDIFKQEIQKRFHLKNILIWNKGGNGMGDLRTDYGGIYEMIIFAVNKSGNQKPLNGKRDTNILNFKRTGNKLHPTEKPVEMFEYLINKSSNENDTILDTFAGSGTTGVACKNTGRNYILMEKEPEYIEIIKKRLNAE